MIDEGLALLDEWYFTNMTTTASAKAGIAKRGSDKRKRDDAVTMIPLELFFASTQQQHVRSFDDIPTTYIVDARKPLPSTLSGVSECDEDDGPSKLARYEEKERLAGLLEVEHINKTMMNDPRVLNLAMYLTRALREKRTTRTLQLFEEERRKRVEGRVSYISASFFFDGLLPLYVGVDKKRVFSRLITNLTFTPAPGNNSIRWTINGNSHVTTTVFTNKLGGKYEEILSRLLLSPVFRLRTHTQRMSPRGALLAYMAMFAPITDPVLLDQNTTLRGLFANVLDGAVFKGMTFASLLMTPPLPINCMDGVVGEYQRDLVAFCNNVINRGWQAVFLTLLGVQVWTSTCYPEEWFLSDPEKGDNIKITQGTVVLHGANTWIFNQNNKSVMYTSDFRTLLACLGLC